MRSSSANRALASLVVILVAATEAHAQDAAEPAPAPTAPAPAAPAAPAPAAPAAPAPTAPAVAAPTAPAPTVPAPTAPAVAAPAPAAPSPPSAKIGQGFHLFDESYWLLGFGLLAPCQATAVELEMSFVPEFAISRGLWWGGAYVAAGFARSRPPSTQPPSNPARCFDEDTEKGDEADNAKEDRISYRRNAKGQPFSDYGVRGLRLSGGFEGGWRMIAADVGYVSNDALIIERRAENAENDDAWIHGLRFRAGLALAHEIFSGSNATYGTACCKTTSETACECERTPVGVSLFLYYGNELYWGAGDWWADNLVGLTLKIGVGL